MAGIHFLFNLLMTFVFVSFFRFKVVVRLVLLPEVLFSVLICIFAVFIRLLYYYSRGTDGGDRLLFLRRNSGIT